MRFREEKGEEKIVEGLYLSGIEMREESKLYTICNVQRVSKRILYPGDAYLLDMCSGISIQIVIMIFLLRIFYVSCWHQLVLHRPFNSHKRAKANLGKFISLC